MDCQKFDQVVMDALYEELDELTSAALRRHVESCSRCGEIWNGLRATREAAVLPIEQPDEALEARILAAVSVAHRTTPWHRKALRGLAWAGSHAMRPQLTMAALFVLVIGSSLLLLRAKPGTVGTSPVRVTEHGVPVPDQNEAAAQAPAAAPIPATPAAPIAAAPADESARRSADATEKREAQASGDAQKALADARAVRDQSGCGSAVRLYDDVGARFPGTPQGADAMWEAAQCQKNLGNGDKARELLLSLRSREGYKERAEEALREGEDATALSSGAGQAANRAPVAAASPPTTSRAESAEAPAEVVVDEVQPAPGGGPGGKAKAAPAPSPQRPPPSTGAFDSGRP
jgi:hypothetical protein